MTENAFAREKKCDTCRYWSEMIARCSGGGPVEAMCLSQKSANRQKYTTARVSCDSWESGEDGVVDAEWMTR